MSAAATTAGYLYASGRLTARRDAKRAAQPCEKKRYDTEFSALSNAAYRMSKGAVPLRVYYCDRCAGHHLTSKEPRL